MVTVVDFRSDWDFGSIVIRTDDGGRHKPEERQQLYE